MYVKLTDYSNLSLFSFTGNQSPMAADEDFDDMRMYKRVDR